MAKRVKIPGRLESAETGNIVTGADAIMDDEKGKTQVVINSEVDAAIINLAQGKQNVLTFDNTPTEDSPNPVTSGGVYTADKVLSDAIEAILLLIPSAASALNKLVDMQTMNSSIATATASFKGTYNLVSDLHLGVDATHEQIGAALDALSLDADNNDYAFVQIPNNGLAPTEIRKTERYKYNGTNWLFEYDLNNSGFTQGQWNAINSGVTSLLVGKLSDLPTNAELTNLLAGKQDNLTFDNVPTAGSPNPVKSGGVYARNNEIVALINALDVAKQDVLTFDNAPVEGSPNPVKSGGVYTAISAVQAAIVALDAAKQNVLTFDSTPTLGSTNPVTSSGIKTELNRIDGNITTLNDLYEALTQSALVIVQPTDTWPVASPATKTIYRVVDRVNTPPQNYSDYMWNGSAMVLMATYDNAIDDNVIPNSENLVNGKGIARGLKEISQDITWNFGYYIDTQGVVKSTDNAWAVSEDIHLKKGDILFVEAVAFQNCVLGSVENNVITPIFLGNGTVGYYDNSHKLKYRYQAEYDIDVKVSIVHTSQNDPNYFFNVKLFNDGLFNLPDNKIARYPVFYDVRFFKYYINGSGQRISYEIPGSDKQYSISSSIKLHKGDTLSFEVMGSEFAALSKTDLEQSFYSPVILWDETKYIYPSGSMHTYHYTADEDCFVAISGENKKFELTGKDIQQIAYISNEAYLQNNGRVNKEGIYGILENRYLDNDGNVVSYNGYFITTPIHVKEGDTISFKYRASQTCLMAEYSNDVYTPLVLAILGNPTESNGTNIAIHTFTHESDIVLCGSIIEDVKISNYSEVVIYTQRYSTIQNFNSEKDGFIFSMARQVLPMKNTNIAYPVFLITTDIHNDWDTLRRAYTYADLNPDVAASFMLGDLPDDMNGNHDLDGGISDELFLGYKKPILRVYGNHEILTYTHEQLGNFYFTPDIISHNGEIHPTGKAYWYKDFAINNDTEHFSKIRVIGIDPYETTPMGSAYSTISLEQFQWICGLLDEVDEKTYVIFITHYSIGAYSRSQIYNEYFSVSELLGLSEHYHTPNLDFISEIVDAWMYGRTINASDNDYGLSHVFTGNKARQFVCFINGHEHEDTVYHVNGYSKQINVSLTCTCSFFWQLYGDLPRTTAKNRKIDDAVTLFSFDPVYRRINLCRLGSDVTKLGVERKYVSFALPDV